MFFPDIFFDIKLWINNWNNKNILLLRIIKYEFMNLFDNELLWKNAYSEFMRQLEKYPPSSVFSFILNLLNIILL